MRTMTIDVGVVERAIEALRTVDRLNLGLEDYSNAQGVTAQEILDGSVSELSAAVAITATDHKGGVRADN